MMMMIITQQHEDDKKNDENYNDDNNNDEGEVQKMKTCFNFEGCIRRRKKAFSLWFLLAV